MSALSIRSMNQTTGTRDLSTTKALALKLMDNDIVINAYKAQFGGKAAIELSLSFKVVDELIAEMKRQLAESKPTPPICDAHGKIKGAWREPSTDDPAHLARYGY